MKEVFTARVQAFLREFPWIGRYLEIHRLENRPTIQRVDLDLLDNYAWTHNVVDLLVKDRRFFLVDRAGSELLEVKQRDRVEVEFKLFRPSTWFSTREVAGETVMDAIGRLTNPDLVWFVVQTEDTFRRKGEHDPSWGLTVTLHKVPTGRTFSTWLAEIPETAATELSDVLTAVDARS